MKGFHVNIPTTKRFIASISGLWIWFIIALWLLFKIYIHINTAQLKTIDIDLNSAFLSNSSLDINVQLDVNMYELLRNYDQKEYSNLIYDNILKLDVFEIKYRGYTTDSTLKLPIESEFNNIFQFHEDRREYLIENKHFLDAYKHKYKLSPMISLTVNSEETHYSATQFNLENIWDNNIGPYMILADINGYEFFPSWKSTQEYVDSCLTILSDSVICDTLNHLQYSYITDGNRITGSILGNYLDENDNFKKLSLHSFNIGDYFTNITGTVLTKINIQCSHYVPIKNTVENSPNDTNSILSRNRLSDDFYFFNNLSHVNISFEYHNTPLSINSIYPQPDQINSHGFMYLKEESISQVLNSGILINAEDVKQKSFVNKLNFIIASLIGIFTTLLVEIVYKNHKSRKEKKRLRNKIIVKGFRRN